MKHLMIDCCCKYISPKLEIKKLGITYQFSQYKGISDQHWFWNCENIPKNLPKQIEELFVDPIEQIGLGLSKEEALSIKNYKQKPKD